MNFEEPQDPISINGFPVYFGEYALTEDYSLWVPGSISRNSSGRCWRIAFYHLDGSKSLYIYDSDSGGIPLESLKAAWRVLVELMETHHPYVLADKRKRNTGPRRDPLVETGITGVHVVRNTKRESGRKHYKYVSVVAQQQLRVDSKAVNRPLTIGTITLHQYQTSGRVQAQKRFEEFLRQAVAVRRYYNQRVSLADPPSAPILYEDVPVAFRAMSYTSSLDVEKILHSF